LSGAYNWLRDRQSGIGGSDDEEGDPIAAKLASLSNKPQTEEEKRAAEMANALDWLRTSDTIDDIDDEVSLALSVGTFKVIDSSLPGTSGLASAVDWLRAKNNTSVEDDDEGDEGDKMKSTKARWKIREKIKSSGDNTAG
jgi:hypothetical protein